MRLYKRQDFLKLPAMTIYSKVPSHTDICEGLFCKMSSSHEYKNDFVEQDLISEGGYPDGIDDGLEALLHQIDLRDNFKDFRTDLHCAGRDGQYDDEICYVVWDSEDVMNLYKFLGSCLNTIIPIVNPPSDIHSPQEIIDMLNEKGIILVEPTEKTMTIDESISMLEKSLEGMVEFDDEETNTNFILDIVDKYRKELDKKYSN